MTVPTTSAGRKDPTSRPRPLTVRPPAALVGQVVALFEKHGYAPAAEDRTGIAEALTGFVSRRYLDEPASAGCVHDADGWCSTHGGRHPRGNR